MGIECFDVTVRQGKAPTEARDASAMEVQSAKGMCREVGAMVKNLRREWGVRWRING